MMIERPIKTADAHGFPVSIHEFSQPRHTKMMHHNFHRKGKKHNHNSNSKQPKEKRKSTCS